VQLTREPERVVITIEDDGPGIPPSEREKVLNLSTGMKLSPQSRDWRGRTRLSVTRSIIWEHGGDIRLANRQEGGLHVRLDLPGPESQTPTDTERAEREVVASEFGHYRPELVRRRIPRCPVSRRGVDCFRDPMICHWRTRLVMMSVLPCDGPIKAISLRLLSHCRASGRAARGEHAADAPSIYSFFSRAMRPTWSGCVHDRPSASICSSVPPQAIGGGRGACDACSRSIP